MVLAGTVLGALSNPYLLEIDRPCFYREDGCAFVPCGSGGSGGMCESFFLHQQRSNWPPLFSAVDSTLPVRKRDFVFTFFLVMFDYYHQYLPSQIFSYRKDTDGNFVTHFVTLDFFVVTPGNAVLAGHDGRNFSERLSFIYPAGRCVSMCPQSIIFRARVQSNGVTYCVYLLLRSTLSKCATSRVLLEKSVTE